MWRGNAQAVLHRSRLGPVRPVPGEKDAHESRARVSRSFLADAYAGRRNFRRARILESLTARPALSQTRVSHPMDRSPNSALTDGTLARERCGRVCA